MFIKLFRFESTANFYLDSYLYTALFALLVQGNSKTALGDKQ